MTQKTTTQANSTDTKPLSHDVISAASAWVLRTGVVISALVMLAGSALTFYHGTISIQRITSDRFDYNPVIIWNGVAQLQGKRVIEAGIYLLLFTPIMRVLASCLLFAFHERDRLYTFITLIVLLLTLTGLLWIG
jgi:uncharacterized membrane protein